MYENVKVKIVGVSALIMHNGQTASPLNEFAKRLKEITAVRKKTDEHIQQISEIEFHAGLYLNEQGRVIIPGEVMEATIVNGAKKFKLGKHFKAGLMVPEDILLKYEGPKDLAKLLKDERLYLRKIVKIGMAKVLRTRPIFHVPWSIEFNVSFLPDILKMEEIKQAMIAAGRVVGLCDWRPRYGRFEVESIEEVN